MYISWQLTSLTAAELCFRMNKMFLSSTFLFFYSENVLSNYLFNTVQNKQIFRLVLRTLKNT